ncbi:ABC transporter permease subunit [Bacillaceae bacterium Marseille-Q3522]|nr:ABC transporter permease subunit [Bacillaceae bacterium Marseille-Q3522]
MKTNKSAVTAPFWRNRKIIPVIAQIVFLVIVLIASYFFVQNIINSYRNINMVFGFDFLDGIASLPIAESLISYVTTDTYLRAVLVGILNTLRVAFFGIILATIVGVFVGIARLSNNWLLSKIAAVYIDIFRNTPLLVQIFIWYVVFLQMPAIGEALKIGPFYFSNRGSAIPWLEAHRGTVLWLILLAVGIITAIVIYKLLTKKQEETGKRKYPLLYAALTIAVICLIAGLVTQSGPFHVTVPEIDGKNFVGGLRLSQNFFSLLIALVIYTSTYIAEIVRAGIQGVSKGQLEAAKALGFKPATALRLIIFPQAVRIIIPPLTSQYLNLTKNSSLAVAIGYQEIVSIGNTIMNQSGRNVEMILVMIMVYLIFSIVTSILMNLFNKKFQLIER